METFRRGEDQARLAKVTWRGSLPRTFPYSFCFLSFHLRPKQPCHPCPGASVKQKHRDAGRERTGPKETVLVTAKCIGKLSFFGLRPVCDEVVQPRGRPARARFCDQTHRFRFTLREHNMQANRARLLAIPQPLGGNWA